MIPLTDAELTAFAAEVDALDEAEQWDRRAIEAGKDDPLLRSFAIHNLAHLLLRQPNCLAEAQADTVSQ